VWTESLLDGPVAVPQFSNLLIKIPIPIQLLDKSASSLESQIANRKGKVVAKYAHTVKNRIDGQ
jgi:hypothetical protein